MFYFEHGYVYPISRGTEYWHGRLAMALKILVITRHLRFKFQPSNYTAEGAQAFAEALFQNYTSIWH